MSDSSAPAPPAARTTRRSAAASAAPPSGAPLGLLVFEQASLVALQPAIRAPLRLGRAADCGLRLRDPEISRHHCELRPLGEGLRLRDLGSVNGCLLDGRRVESARLVHGDSLLLGQTLIRVVSIDSEEWRLHQRLFSQLYGDPLTGLLNPRGLRLQGDAMLEALPTGAGAALLLLRFDADPIGQSVDESWLCACARALNAELPPPALCARLAESEFAALLREDFPARLLQRIDGRPAVLSTRRAADSGRWRPRCGVAWQAAPLRDSRSLLECADGALQRARQRGGGGWELGFVMASQTLHE